MSAEVKVDFVGKDDGLQRSFGALDKYLTSSKKKVQELDSAASKLGGGGGGIGKLAIGIGAANAAFGLLVSGIGKVTDFMKSSVLAAMESEKQLSRLESVVKNNGAAYGMSVDSISAYSNELARNTAFTSAANNEAAIFLATLKNVSAPDQFKETLKVSQDLATVFNMSLPAAAKAVGKALDNPIQGMNNLRKYGVMLTEDQKKQVAGFMAINDVASAQGVVMDAIKAKVEGAADAYGKTGVGQLERFKNIWGEIKEEFGKGILDKVVEQSEEILNNAKEAAAVRNAARQAGENLGTAVGVAAEGAMKPVSWYNQGVGYTTGAANLVVDALYGNFTTENAFRAYRDASGITAQENEIRNAQRAAQAEAAAQAQAEAARAAERAKTPLINLGVMYNDVGPDGKPIKPIEDKPIAFGPQLPGVTGHTKEWHDAYKHKQEQDMTRISNHPLYKNFTPGILQFGRAAMKLAPMIPGPEGIVDMARQVGAQFAPKGFQSTFEDAQGMYDRIQLSAGSKSDEALIAEHTKKTADAVGEIVKDGVKLKNNLVATFSDAASALNPFD